MDDQHVKRFLLKLQSGAVAGIIGTTIVFPIDLLKTRLQTIPTPTSTTALLKSVYASQGLRGFYSGLSANLVGVTPEKAIKLAVNDAVREWLSGGGEVGMVVGMVAGGCAGFAQVIATCPMEAVKIRMQLATTASNNSSTTSNMIDVVKTLRLTGLYKGAGATLARDVPFSVMFFQGSAWLRQRLGGGYEGTLVGGVVAGAVAAVLATPMDVVKTRIQAAHGRQPMLGVYRQVYGEAGWRGLFRGATQRACIVAPLFGISLLVYDIQQRLLLT